MEQFEKIIQKNRKAVADRIHKSLNIELQLSEGETRDKTVKKAFSDELSSVYNKVISHEEFWEEMQKAHKDGDMHPNGKWVWVSSANGGRGDWRTLGGKIHSKSSSSKESGSKELKDREKESSSIPEETKTKLKIKDFPGYKGVKMVEGEGYVVAFGKGRDRAYEVYPYLDYENKKGNSMVIGLKGNSRGSLKEARELSMKIAEDLKDKKVLDTLRNMEKDFISKMKGKTATEIKKFEFSWEDVLKASREK